MSTALEVVFPWGLYHANPWGRDVNEAAVDWPPSPWRILRALYATWQWRRPDLPAGSVVGVLGELAAPPAYLLPTSSEAHTRHYMPDLTHMRDRPKTRADTKYSGDAVDRVLDPFVVVARDARMLIRWPCDLGGAARVVLGALAAGLSYLGRSESLCTARLIGIEGDAGPERGEAWLEPLPDGSAAAGLVPGGSLRVLAPTQPLDLAALTRSTAELRARGFTVPPGSRWLSYPVPPPTVSARAPGVQHRRPTAVRWAFASPARPSVKASVAMADVLRQACMSQYGRNFRSEASPQLAGKDAEGRKLIGHRHAHYLALDSDEDQLVDHLVLWAPGGLGERELQALAGLDRLTGYGHVADFRPGRLGLEALGEVATVAPELVGPAQVWRSVTPFAPSRHAHKHEPWDLHVIQEVREELAHRSFPVPTDVRLLPRDWLTFRRRRVQEHLEDNRRAVGVRITFDHDVRGPIALGSLSHFSLGLFRPDNESAARR